MKVVLVLFAVFALACANIYDVVVQLGSQRFVPVKNATLNMVVIGKLGQRNHFKIGSGNLTSSSNHSAQVSMPFELKNINFWANSTFYWTQATPSKIPTRKPVIFLDHVMISDTLNTARRTGTMRQTKFIPAIANQTIAHKQEIKLRLKYYSE